MIMFLLTVMLLTSCKEEKKQEKVYLRPVAYQKVEITNNKLTRTFSGTAQTGKVITLSFRASGILTQFNIQLGQSVEKGQLLGTLDNVESRLNHERAISALNSDESQMNTAKSNLDRVRALYEKGGSSLSDYESAKNTYKTAVAAYESSIRSVEIQEEQIRYGYLYAPEGGTISQVEVEIDENISAGQPIAVLNAGEDMEILLGLPESIINRVKKNMEVNISFPSLPNKIYKGIVYEVSPSINREEATYPVSVRMVNPSEEIKSGMAANVSFDFLSEQSENSPIIIPASAVGEDENGHFVFVVETKSETTGVVSRRAISFGELTARGFEIKHGLSHGDHIAIAGLQTLLDGQEVKLK